MWLTVGLDVWPFLSRLLNRHILQRRIDGSPVSIFPFTLVEHGQMTIGSLYMLITSMQQIVALGFVLIGVLYLCRAPQPSSLPGAPS
jgi:hypothetical protein